MKIPLTYFEEVIPPKILERGLAYYEDGAVETPEPINEDTFTADVIGTNVYTITYQLIGTVMTDFSCTCPYADGPVCKHVAALLFYLRAEELFVDTDLPVSGRKRGKKAHDTPDVEPKRRGRPPGTAKSKSTGDGVSSDQASGPTGSPKKRVAKKRAAKKPTPDSVLDQLPVEQLRAFIREEVLSDKALKVKFMLRFAGESGAATVKTYVTQVRTLLRSIPMRTGYEAWRAGPRISKAIEPMLQLLDDKVIQGRDYEAIRISFALLEVFTDLIEKVDDSFGYLSNVLSRALNHLTSAANRELDDPLRTEFLSTCLDYYKRERFEGWDWHADMLGLAVPLCRTPQEAGELMDLLDRQSREEGYAGAEAVRWRYLLLGRLEGEDSAETFLQAHLGIPEMRMIAIDRAFREGDLSLARELAQAGLAASNKAGHRYLQEEWHKWLLRIATTAEDTATICQEARILFFDGDQPMQMLGILKRHTDPDKWPALVDSIIAVLSKSTHYKSERLYLALISFTGDDERLMAFLLDPQTSHELPQDTFHEMATRLYSRWPDEVLDAYEGYILPYFEHGHTTKDYQRAAQLLVRMKKLGDLDRVSGFVGKLRKRFARRPALVAVLDKI